MHNKYRIIAFSKDGNGDVLNKYPLTTIKNNASTKYRYTESEKKRNKFMQKVSVTNELELDDPRRKKIQHLLMVEMK